MKERHDKDVLYALADYKQLVLAYKTKQADLIKSITFWKTSVMWLAIITICFAFMVIFLFFQAKINLTEEKKNTAWLNNRAENISGKLYSLEQELGFVREELKKKETLIKELEKNMSTASKNLLEKLLKEQEAEAPTK